MTTTRTLSTAAIASLLMAAGNAHAQSVEIENFIGSVEIVEGARLAIEGERAGTAEIKGSRLVVDGGESERSVNRAKCRVSARDGEVDRVRINRQDLSDYPTLRITVPDTGALVVSDSILFGTVSDLADVDVALPNCGLLTFGDVSEMFDVRVSGSADIYAGSVGEARLSTSGSGDFEILEAESLTFRSSGSGDLAAGEVTGPVFLRSSGSGDAVIAKAMDGVEWSSSGSGDLLVGEAAGDLDFSTTGAGDAVIESGDIATLSMRTTGSGDAAIHGSVGDADVVSTGSGDVYMKRHTGRLTFRSTGSGEVTVGDE